MNNELISIIIPVYNIENLLSKCINSVITQTYSNLEIILVDDGSTDNSGNICDFYSKKDNRIKVYHKKNGGLSSARNHGIEHSSGNYLFFLDSDDFIDSNMIEILFENMIKTQSNISMGNRINYYDNGKETIRFSGGTNIKIFNKMEALEEMNLYNYFDMSSCGKIFEKKLFENIVFPEGKLCEDYYIMYKLLDKCSNIVYVPNVYYYYYQRTGSISKNPKINWDFVYAANEQREFLSTIYPELSVAMDSAVCFAYLTIYDIMIHNKGKLTSDELTTIKKGVKDNFKSVRRYKRIKLSKKFQLYIFIYLNGLYNMIYSFYKNIRR